MTNHITQFIMQMRAFRNLLWICTLFFAGINFTAQAVPPPGQPWNLVWSDEFNGPSLDTNLWGYGKKPWGTTDNSPCLITPEDSYLQNSNLVLRSRMGTFSGNGTTYNFTSGWVWSKIWLTYGYMEIRAQYPAGKGQWPAWWMLRNGWPPEFDIAEFRGSSGTNSDYMTQAVYDEAAQWNSTTLGGDYTDWHTYGFEWGPGYLKWSIDGAVTKTVNTTNIPSQAMYVILSAGLDSSADASTGFPNYYVIDYFRWYQLTATNAPAVPTGLAATSSSNQVTLNWSAPDRAAGYIVKRAAVSGGPYTTIGTTTGLAATQFTDTNVVSFSSYYYVVSAVNTIGESANSSEAGGMPTPPPISTGKPVTASTVQSPNYETNGNDGDFSTRWTASSGSYPQWWRVDLGSVQTIRKVTINWEASSAWHRYKIEVSNDDSTYTTVVDKTGSSATGNSADFFTASGRYVRVTVTGASSGWASFYECQVFGGTPPGTPSGLLAATVSANQIDLNWAVGSGATSYAIKRSTTSGGPYATIGSSSTTSYSDTGLTGNTTYYYVVASLSGGGESPNTTQASATTLTGPAAPTGLVATGIATNQINLSWSPVGGASSYKVKRAIASGGPYATIATGVASTSYPDISLSSGTRYYYVVSAVNANGEGSNSGQASAVTVPDPPTSLSATPGYGQAVLSWNASPGATTYNLWRATTSGGPYTAIASDLTILSYTNTGLVNGTPYYYVVTATNGSGVSGHSAEASATPSGAAYLVSLGQPASAQSMQSGHPPTDGNDGNNSTRWTASGGSYPQWWKVDLGSVYDLSSAIIRWENSAASYKFKIETSKNDISYALAVDETARAATGDSTNNFAASGRYVRVTVTGSSAGWASFYECSLYGTPGTSSTPPPAPAGLSATGVSASQINLAWTASSGATGYNVKRATTDGGPYVAVATGVAGTSYSNTGLSGGTKYYYVVTAVNADSESANSVQADATTAPGAPSGLVATAGDTQVTLSWTATATAATYNVKRATNSGGSYSTIATGIVAPGYTNTGLVNGATYYYVVSAVNSSGEGGNSTEVNAMPLALLSQGKPATASSTESGRSPSQGNDENLSTRWTASGGSYPQWWKVDLNGVQSVRRAMIRWESSASRSYRYLIEISNDDTNYVTLVNQTNRTDTGDSVDTFTAAARYVRVTVTGSTGGWASFYECSIYGIPGTTGAPPSAPVGLAATAASTNQINLIWNASSGADSYYVKRATNSGGPYAVVATGVVVTNYSDPGLSAGSTYYYVVSAANGSGESANSTEASATPLSLLSLARAATASSSQGGHDPSQGNDGSFSTRWTASGGSFPQWWRVDLGAVQTISKVAINWENSGSWSYKYLIETSNDDTNYSTMINQTNRTATGDTTDTFTAAARYVRATVTGASGGAWASFFECSVYGVPGAIAAPPSAPASLIATTVSSSQINLSWTASSGATAYNLKRATTIGGPYTAIATNLSVTNFSNIGLTSGTTYYYVVSASGAGGEGTNSAQASAITIPAAPGGLAATAGTGQVSLRWNSSTGASTYSVKRSLTNGGPYGVVAGGVAGTNYTDATVINGLTYYYVVSAVNSGGESAYSAMISAHPVSSTPPQISVAVNGGNLQLTWPSENTGWRLLALTNSAGLVSGANWVEVPAAAQTNQMTFPLDPASGAVFYRMVFP